MSDLGLSVTAQAPEVGSQFDVTNLDRALREVNAIERSWRLPALPDAVKLDLISSPDVTAEGLGAFLRGIDSDFNPEPEPEPTTIPTPLQLLEEQRSGVDQFRVGFAGIAGEPAPTRPSVDAVEQFKLRAVEKGYLPEDTTIDPTWSPELNSIRGSMAFDDYNDRLRGNRPGAVSTNTAIDILGKWTSPTGLLAAATELDLFWDFGAIGGEFSSWGDKWRKLDEAKNPFDFGAKLVDALTGPLDDIIIPAANLLLLGSGVGAVTNTARIGWMASKTGLGAKFVRGLYTVTDVRSAANLVNLGEKSWMATRLVNSAGSGRQALGGAMAAWRAATPVRNTKAGVQLGMRLGFTSQVQDLLPGYQGGLDLSEAPIVGDANQRLRGLSQNPAAMIPELLLAPYNIFTPGTFLRSGGEGVNAVSRLASGLLTVSGSAGGRAAIGGAVGLGVGTVVGDDLGEGLTGALIGAGAAASAPAVGELLGSRIGVHGARSLTGAVAGAGIATLMDDDADALDVLKGSVAGVTLVSARSAWNASMRNGNGTGKYIGYVSDFLKHTSFQPLADNQRVAQTFHEGLLRGLNGEELERYQGAFARTGSFKKAFAEFLGVDDEAAGAATAYVMTSAAIDHTARVQAGFVGSEGSMERYHLFRNKLIAQLRTFDLQNPTTATIRDIARSKAMEHVQDSQKFNREFRRWEAAFLREPEKALEFARQHNDVAADTLRQLMSPENLPGFGRVSEVAPSTDDGLGIIAEYLPQAMPTFGNWAQFDAVTRQVDDALHSGILEPAVFKSARSRFGREMRGVRRQDIVPVSPVSEGISEALLGGAVDVAKATTKGRFSVLANLSPAGRFTVARKSTPSKQQVLKLSDQVQDLLEAQRDLDSLAIIGTDVSAVAHEISAIESAQIRAVLKQVGSARAQRPVERLLRFAERRGIPANDLGVEVRRLIDEMVDDMDTWRSIGLDEFVWDELEDGRRLISRGRAALDKRYRQLVEKERFTAAEVDLDDLIRHYDETGQVERADEVRALAAGLDGDDYKLVHGVEFLMPHDLAVSPAFEDISRRNTNFMTLGNFFKGRLPAEARMAEERRQRLALATSLQDRAPTFSDDLGPESDAVSNVLRSLRVVLEDLQETSRASVDQLHNQNWWNRRATALQSSTTPLRLEDLLPRKELVINKLRDLGYTEDVAEAAWLALPGFRNAEFRDLGLYSLEAKLRQRNELVQSLKFLSGSKYGQRLTTTAAARQAVIGAGAGALVDDRSGDDGLADGAVVGALTGALSGAATGKALTKLIPRAEMSRYGYLGDTYARARDALRFTLSPWFDISRFSEGYMLAQTAAPLRNPITGERLVMPLNASPSAIRKSIKQGKVDLASLGLPRIPADVTGRDLDAVVRARFADIRSQFRAAALGDFDLEVLDSTGKWFAQVGIAGFNPTDWMATAFANLRINGFSTEEAYRHARSMYTYGTRGRSAAELSVNFVLFPFSFQKKALTHLGQWMNDDLSRSIMIHDAFKTYEVLDEEYNLDEIWRDHLPALQQLNKLNLFAFGISPGRLGGINAQAIETGFKASMGLFTPQGFSLTNAKEAAELEDLYRSMMPAINDINWMVQNLKEQGHVLTSESHQTTSADVSQGYNEWNEYKQRLSQTLATQGFTWSDMQRKAYLAPMKAAYELKRAEISAKYPAWKTARDEAVYNAVALERERSDRLARAAADPATASVDDLMLAQFEQELEQLRTALRYQGVEVGGSTGWLDAPPEAFQYVTALGVDLLRRNPGWRRIWDKLYRSQFGMLEAPV